jgi:hypothetical protein
MERLYHDFLGIAITLARKNQKNEAWGKCAAGGRRTKDRRLGGKRLKKSSE